MPQTITREVLTSGKLCHREKMTAEGGGHGPQEEARPPHLHQGQGSTSPNVPSVQFRESGPCRGSGDSSTADDDIRYTRGSLTHTTNTSPSGLGKCRKSRWLPSKAACFPGEKSSCSFGRKTPAWQAPPPGQSRPQEAGPHEARESSGSRPPTGQSTVDPDSILPCPLSEVRGPRAPGTVLRGGHCPGVPSPLASPPRRHVSH